MLKINKIKERPAKLFHENNFIGIVEDQYQLNDIRLQVVQNNLKNVYFVFELSEGIEQQINVNSDGSLDCWPDGFFDEIEKQLFKLLR